ncbi:MAG: putative Ig domain-containing protein [Proteobacteria bacterium]|nr:putative Ig domain-containing protein [Pseudomonadota bacterium]
MRSKIFTSVILFIILLFPIFAFAAFSLTLTPPGDKSVDEGATLSFQLSASGGTIPYTYTYTAIPAITNATITNSGSPSYTGTFSWTPSNSQAGTYSVTFTATDSKSPTPKTASQTITITVVDVTTPGLAPIGNKSVDEGETLQFTISATDADGDTLTYSFLATPSLPGATINSSTGAFIWTPGDDKADSYSVTYTATDTGNKSTSEAITIEVDDVVCDNPDLPAIDFVGSWTFTPTIVGGKNVGGTLVLYSTLVTTSVISSSEFYLSDTPGIEEIIGAAVNVPNLTRDSANPYLFADSTLSITETGNTYLSSSLVNIQFTVGTGPYGPRLNMNAICFNSHNLPDMDKSTNTRPSRFIDTLITEGDGPDYPNMRLTLDILSGPGDFSSTTASSGSCAGKIESAVQPTLIDLALFEATPVNREVVVIWVTASEIDNVGFNLYRSESEVGGYVKLNSSIILAEGMATAGATYQYVDENVKNRKTYYYMLEDIDIYGISTYHGPVSATPRLIFGGINR